METNQTPHNGTAKRAPALSLEDQVALDLADYLERFPNKSFAVRVLAKESGLSEKTVKRLLKSENKPTYQTIFKLYSIFFDEPDYQALLEKCPVVVSDYIKDYSPVEAQSSTTLNHELLELLKKEPLFAELLVLAGTGPLHTSAIGYRYGQYGLEVLERLEKAEVLIKVSKESYTVSSKLPNFDGHALKFLGEYFVHRFSRPNDLMSENTISFYAEGLNEEGLKAWLSVDTQAFYKKIEIAKNSKYKGAMPVFTFTATDKIVRESK